MKLRTAILATSLVALISTVQTYASDSKPNRGGDGPKQITKCRTIHKPGSYVVTQNLIAEGESGCLVIEADNVTLDLGGFVLSNPGDFDGDGITDKGVNRRRIVVRNGTIRDFNIGIDLDSTDSAIIESIDANGDENASIRVGFDSIVRDNTTSTGGGVGGGAIKAKDSSIVSDNICIGGSALAVGMQVGKDSVVTGNIAIGFEGTGITVGEGSTVSGNTARGNSGSFDNSSEGIIVRCPSTVIGNTATDNTATNNGRNLLLLGDGCVDVNNAAP
jgi:hypothetical protein